MEVLFVSVIMILVAGILIIAFTGSQEIIETINILAELQAKGRWAINAMTLDLRRTASNQITIFQDNPSAGIDKIEYYLPADSDSDGVPDINGTDIIWNATKATISLDLSDSGKLLKTEGAEVTPLASNVKTVNFLNHSLEASLYFDELKVTLGLEKISSDGRVYTTNSTSIINMRN